MKRGDDLYQYEIKNSHSYLEKIDQVTLPNDIVKFLRDSHLKEAKNKILECLGKTELKYGYGRITPVWLEEHIAYVSDFINLYEFEEKEIEPFDVKKYLIFS